MVGGPYGTGAMSAAERAANLARMNEAALAVWRKGHVPIIGVNVALPIVAAGKTVFRSADEVPPPLAREEEARTRRQAKAFCSNTTSVALLSKR
jgi:hypothetical protein